MVESYLHRVSEGESSESQEAGAHNWQALVTAYPGEKLAEFLKDREVREYCIEAMKNVGCPETAARPIYSALLVAAKLASKYTSDSALTKLTQWLLRFQVARSLLAALAKTHVHWHHKETFRRHLIAELKPGSTVADVHIDHALPEDIARDLWQHEKLEELVLSIADLDELLPGKFRAELQAEIQRQHQPVLSWNVQRQTSASAANRIKYNSGAFPFLGREAEVATLHRFLADHRSRFSWTLVTGAGGTGKTRLAYEFTREFLSVRWNAGRLVDLNGFDAERFRPIQPTFIVIDYPAQFAAEVGTLLAALQRNHTSFVSPVRVLLLERDTLGPWIDRVLPAGGDSAAVVGHYWQPWAGKEDIGWELPPVMPNAIVAMMMARLRAGEISELPSSEELIAAAARMDPRVVEFEGISIPIPRPLFAAATCEAIIGAGKRDDWQELIESLDREDLLHGLIRRDRDQIWRKAGSGNDRAAMDLHENLLALATFGNGIDRDRLTKAVSIAGNFLPDLGIKERYRIDWDLLHAMSGGEQGFVRSLEPDVLGEHFLLSLFSRLESESPLARRALCEAALCTGGMDSQLFILRCYKDFPDLLEQLDFLSPASDAPIEYGAAFGFASVCVDLISLLGAAENWQAADRVMAVIAQLRSKFEDDIEIAICQAQAAYNTTNHASAADDWQRVEEMLSLLTELRAGFPSEPTIALQQAKAAHNLSRSARNAGLPDRTEKLRLLLAQLRDQFPRNRDIALEQTKSMFNVVNHALKTLNWEEVDRQLIQIAKIRTIFSDDLEIALFEARSATNIINFCNVPADRARIKKILSLIEKFHHKFHEDREIVTYEAKLAVDLINKAGKANDWSLAESLLIILSRLCGRHADDREIWLEYAKGAVNVTLHAGAARKWALVKKMVNLISRMRSQFVDDRHFALREARMGHNVLQHAADAGQWILFDRVHIAISGLLDDFSDDREIVKEAAEAIVAGLYRRAGAGLLDEHDVFSLVQVYSYLGAVSESDHYSINAAVRWHILLKHAVEKFPAQSDALAAFDGLAKLGFDWSEVPNLTAAR